MLVVSGPLHGGEARTQPFDGLLQSSCVSHPLVISFWTSVSPNVSVYACARAHTRVRVQPVVCERGNVEVWLTD